MGGQYLNRCKKAELENLDCILLVADKGLWWVFENMVMDLRIPKDAGNILNRLATRDDLCPMGSQAHLT
jgi:hypothetical protein